MSQIPSWFFQIGQFATMVVVVWVVVILLISAIDGGSRKKHDHQDKDK